MKEVIELENNQQRIKPKKRVAAYARVSEDDDPMLHSVEAQISYYSQLIQSNPDWIYAGVYADKGISGTGVKKRSSFQEMMKACEDGLIDIILCKSISRFARNTVDLLNAIRHLKDLGIEVQFEREHISSLSKDGEFMLTLLASFAQEESRSISENVKWGVRKKFANGEYLALHDHVLGYRYDRENKCYAIIPEEAEIVREIFRLYLEGVTTVEICRILNADGKRSTFGGVFKAPRITEIICNEVYAGHRLLQKKYVESHLTKRQKKNKGEFPKYFCEDTHEAIIDQETFDRAQEEHRRRSEYFSPHYLGYHYENGRYVPVPEEMEVARWIFKRYLERVPLHRIAEELNEKGIKTFRQDKYVTYKVAFIVQSDFYDPTNPEVSEPLLDTETYERVLAEREFREKHQALNIVDGEIKVSNKRMYGYQFDDEARRYTVIPEEAEAIRQIYQLYLDGWTADDIARKLNAEGKRSTFGTEFECSRILAILSNETYTGDLLLQKKYVDKDSKVRKNKGELPQFLLTDVHEAIIDRETFRRVQEERKRRDIFYRHNHLGYRYEDGKYVIDPESVDIVRLIFKMFLEHEKMETIAKILIAQGYKTARNLDFNAKSLKRLTRNDFYDPDNPDVTEPIFDEETYERIKAEREYREEHKFSKGLPVQLLGYTRVDGKYVIDLDNVEIVRLAINMYLEHKTLCEIAEELNKRGYRTLMGRTFAHTTVKPFVTNERYYPGCPDVAEPIFDEETHESVLAEKKFRDDHSHGRGLPMSEKRKATLHSSKGAKLFVPYIGYMCVDRKYVIDPQTVEIIRLVVRRYLEHKSMGEIARELNSEGYRTKKDTAFGASSIKAILFNERYYPGSPDVVEPIFDAKTYEKVMAEKKSRGEDQYLRDPHGAEMIRLAVKLYLEHWTLHKIASELNERGYKPLRGKMFYGSVVKKILLNKSYYFAGDDGAEPIFDAETYEKVLAEERARAENPHGKGLKAHDWLVKKEG